MIPYSALGEEQLEAIEWMQARTEALCFDPVSFGKTVCMLTTIKNLREVYGPWTVLVLTTKRIAELTWGQEIDKWEHLTGQFTYGHAVGRNLKEVQKEPDILAVNFENVEWYLGLVKSGEALQRDILVIDESSFMKSASAGRVKALIGGARRVKAKNGKPARTIFFNGRVGDFKRRYALSATPCAESYANLWAQEACVSTKRRLGENMRAFHERYGTPKWNGFAHQYTVEDDAQKRIEERLKYVSRLPSKMKYNDLPDPIHDVVEVPWEKGARDEYDELEANLEVVLSEEDNPDLSLDEMEIAVDGTAGLLNKLRQLCSGFAYDPDRRAISTADPDAKGDALDSIIERVGGTPLLVFTQFQAEAEYLGSRYPDATIGMPDSLEAWDSGGLPMLCVHPASCGHGLNLQFGSHVCVYYSLPWSHEQWLQSWGRLDRRGQVRRVTALRLERPGSIEGDIWDALQDKDGRLSTFLKRMRARTREA